MIVKKIEDYDTVTYFFSFNKRFCRIIFSKEESKKLFFKNVKEEDNVSDSFECYKLKNQDYKKIFDYITNLYDNIVFDLYLKEDSINIKNLCKYGLKQTGENRFEYKRNN